MTTKGKEMGCRVCGGALQGNQRRWLFGAQQKRESLTPPDYYSRSSQPGSSRSSPWGSSLSLGSSRSLSKSQLPSSSSRGVDLLAVLTHTLNKSVPRGSRRGEFLCGKCVSTLERVFKFDTVIARVRVLSSERLQKLVQERDKLRQGVYNAYRNRNAQEWETRGGASEEEEENGEGRGREEREKVTDGYRDMLRDNMSLSAFECWSEKWGSCPYFQRTGKRCRKGKRCQGCDSLRVSDSDYESVCGVPRALPFQAFSPLALSRDKSRSMPLHWSRMSSVSSDSASSAGSCHSFQEPFYLGSVPSLISPDGPEAFDWPEEENVVLGNILKELKAIEMRPVKFPSGSRIPVWDRSRGGSWESARDRSGSDVIRALSFGDGGHDEDVADGEAKDVLTELTDEFLPLHKEKHKGQMHNVVRHLRGQLDQAFGRIRSLEAELKAAAGHKGNGASQPEGPDTAQMPLEGGEDALLQTLGNALHSRERIIQDCMSLVKMLRAEVGGVDAEARLMEKLTDILKNTDTKQASEAVLRGEREKQVALEREVEALRQATRDRERDLDTLRSALHCNQDVIDGLRVELGERERVLREGQLEREAWRQRDQALTRLLQEKESLTCCLNEALESALKDVQALSDSVIGQGLSGGGAEGALAYQLREKETILSGWLKDREEHSASMWREVNQLTTALRELQTAVQAQRDSHSLTVSTLTAQLRDTQTELREQEKESKKTLREWQREREDRSREERKLRENLEKRDELIQQVLFDSEERDRQLAELQQHALSKPEPRTALKHTL
ncbi:uncharacterized protein si:ch73-95l15.5 [Brienomyrus brachyistius]|uniref:uncharacterized protein si:ch73-95l15.5 n=1 Tax=Brienomyrus brachyistius TaxID=42636 RepID=UPI0020B35217|nr:uncharacterized protein si:ch73-95l15.5 [Brienomyrus brachyistius]XP_048882948.1 uncharacterized protein si:ch73-95l15.5 [Brienomyrus brachyistius]